MCTSLTFESENGHHFLARTMDFGFELGGKPIVMPRNYERSCYFGGIERTCYGFVGTGRKLDDFLFADGVNEAGLAIAELYYPYEAEYQTKEIAGKINLAPHEFIMWVLGQIGSIEELRQKITEVNVVNAEVALLGLVPPLHYIVSDRTGETVVIETNNQKLTIKSNPVGVMTNSPELEWHLKNLNNYLFLKPTNCSNRQVDQLTIHPFGQGSGTFGLPGGFTSPERFVRTVYMRFLAEKGKTSGETLSSIFHILNGVTIPKGVNIKDDGAVDYTQYRAAFDLDKGIYYYNPYETQEVFSVGLTPELLSADVPTEFDVAHQFGIIELNDQN
ncbi:choloylglycine hydrolase family protein [Enterococcus sp. LJL99]